MSAKEMSLFINCRLSSLAYEIAAPPTDCSGRREAFGENLALKEANKRLAMIGSIDS